MRLLFLPLAALALALLPLGCFALDRLEGVAAGTVRGRVVDDGVPVGGARVVIDGSARGVRAQADGSFVIKDLDVGNYALRVLVDEDGDAVPERAALVAFATEVMQFDGANAVSAVLLDDVDVDGVSVVSGRVESGVGGDVGGVRVVVARDLAAVAGGGGEVRTLAKESETRTAADGSFVLRGVVPGPVQVFAVADDGRTAPAVAATLDVGENDLALPLVLGLPEGDRPVQIALAPPPTGEVVLRVVERGVDTPDEVRSLTLGAASEVSTSLPAGVFDIFVDSDGTFGALLDQVVIPTTPDDQGAQRFGVLLLRFDDPCLTAAADKDGDGNDAHADGACVDACAAAFDDDSAVCVDGAVDFDCDDDDDGQPDLTEPPACREISAPAATETATPPATPSTRIPAAPKTTPPSAMSARPSCRRRPSSPKEKAKAKVKAKVKAKTPAPPSTSSSTATTTSPSSAPAPASTRSRSAALA